MPETVPTQDEFAALEACHVALEARVAALEAGTVVPPEPPIEPPIDPPPILDGIQAKRIAALIESFGVNTFSSLDSNNVWGSWPANYSPASTIAALRYIVGDSGFALRIREYHYAGRTNMQKQWLPQIVAAFPGTRVAICPGANASTGDVPTMVQLASDPANGIAWIEGINEPNTNFGSGTMPYETTQAIQDECWKNAAAITVLGPSIVAGTPHPEGWITGYCDDMDALNAAMHESNGHYYPPASPDVPNTGYSVDEYVGGLWGAYAQHDVHLTEFHPTLYNSRGHNPDKPGWSGDRDAYYTLCTLLRCAKNGTRGLWWYALFDYGSTYKCGLFPQHGADNPRPAANALQALCMICADHGTDLRSFAPGKLDIAVDGLTDRMDFDVYQASNGRFLVPIWHAAEDVGQGVAVQIAVSFGANKSEVSVFDPLTGMAEVSSSRDVREVTVDLPPGVVVLEVYP